jgi:5-dehydro-2-deoxygluconokinase
MKRGPKLDTPANNEAVSDSLYDVLTIGRSSIDLYSNDIGSAFTDIKSFSAYVGGCPTNIAVGTRRLGLRSAVLTAVGEDLVGDFLLKFLNAEGVDTQFIARKPGRRTSAVLLGIEPPSRFPLVYYRDNCADIELTIDDVSRSPVLKTRVLVITGTALSREPSRSASIYAAEAARQHGAKICLIIDFRPDQWHDARAFGVVTRSILHLVDIAVGTENEVKAAMLTGTLSVSVEHSQISDAHVTGSTQDAICALLKHGPQAVVITKGEEGAVVYTCTGEVICADPFPVEVYNTLGAGDAFASGVLYGYLRKWEWKKAARMGNACGAIVVTRHGCANFMPYEKEALSFAEERGGL